MHGILIGMRFALIKVYVGPILVSHEAFGKIYKKIRGGISKCR